jgi:hypothetical protein
MQLDTITDQWPWFAAAGLLVVLIVALAAYYFYKPNPKPDDPTQNQQEGWTPTGRIDFTDPHSIENFILQVEETRIDESLGGVEHRAIRWRRATLDEAKRVIVAYHAQRNLATRATFVVTSPSIVRGQSDLKIEHQQGKLGEDEKSDEKPES